MRDPENPWQDELTAATPTPVLTPTDHELRQRAIRNCRLCDTDGYIGTQLCTHRTGYAEAAQRGMNAIRQAMGWNTKPTTNTQETPQCQPKLTAPAPTPTKASSTNTAPTTS